MPIHKNDSTAFHDFFQWYILPMQERLPDELNLSTYAEKYKIARKSLYTWTRSKAFREMLDEYLTDNLGSITQRVKNLLASKALDPDNPDNQKAIEAWFKYCSGLTEKLELSGKVETSLDLATIQRLKVKIINDPPTQ